MLSHISRLKNARLESESSTGRKDHESRNWTSEIRNLASLPGAGTLAGASLCVIAALVTGQFASGHAWRAEVPLMFSIVLLVVALIFGARAGVIGTVLAAIVFATHLFNPVGSYHIASDVARNNLGWMLMIGIAFSFLFAPQKRTARRH